MSKQNNLPDFLIDLADGIRTAEGTTDPINPQDFRSRVEALANSGGGGESGVPIEVAELPTATADTVGKVYLNTTDGNYYVGSNATLEVGTALGNSLYFDTTQNPLDLLNGEFGNELLAIPFLTAQNTATGDTASFMFTDLAEGEGVYAIFGTCGNGLLGIVYIYSETITVEQTAELLGMPITTFGWQADMIDTSEVADYIVTDNYLQYFNNIAYGGSSIGKVHAAEIRDLTAKHDNLFNGNNLGDYVYDCSTSMQPFALAGRLFETLTVGENVTSIGDGAFSSVNVTRGSVSLPDGLTSIGNAAFAYSVGITSITIPAGVTSIPYRCFDGHSLTDGSKRYLSYISVVFAENSQLTAIGDYAFRCCLGLSLTLTTTTPPTLGVDVFDECYTSGYTNMTIYVPAESVETYKAADGWSKYADFIQAKA